MYKPNQFRPDPKPEKVIKDKKYRIPKVSDKRKVLDREYNALRKVFLIENPICQINGKRTTEIHHKYCGKDREKYYLDTSTWMAVNRASHELIHSNPIESRQLGYLMKT
ncbi:MAG: hypothetical protein ABI241_00695 [Bacteroidia bacterium]